MIKGLKRERHAEQQRQRRWVEHQLLATTLPKHSRNDYITEQNNEFKHSREREFGLTMTSGSETARRFFERIVTWSHDQSVTTVDSTMPGGDSNAVTDRMAHEWLHIIGQIYAPMDHRKREALFDRYVAVPMGRRVQAQ